jgi:hypothetical protein
VQYTLFIEWNYNGENGPVKAPGPEGHFAHRSVQGLQKNTSVSNLACYNTPLFDGYNLNKVMEVCYAYDGKTVRTIEIC